jgi:hypothetical protein
MRLTEEPAEDSTGMATLLFWGYLGYLGYVVYLCLDGAIWGLTGGEWPMVLGLPIGIVSLFFCRGAGEIVRKWWAKG